MKASNGLAIDLHHVAKTYRGRVQALRGIEMRVHPGEIFGLLGPNGAGKTTLVKIIMTLVRPSRADGTVLGRPIGHKPTLARTGYLPEDARFPRYLTARQAVEYYGALHNIRRRLRKRRAGELIEFVGMSAWADRKVATFSKGMMQRVALAQVMINDPQLLLLDEPTDGLDPIGRREVRQFLEQLRRQGKTVFLNSHLLGDVERVCDRVAILDRGLVVRQGRLDDLMGEGQYYEIELEPQGGAAGEEALREALSLREGVLPGGRAAAVDGATVRIECADAAAIQPVIDALRGRGLTIKGVRPVRQSLEDFFIEAVGATENRQAPPARDAGEGRP
jgi:ABC-2 type transport system ATP-binding protein